MNSLMNKLSAIILDGMIPPRKPAPLSASNLVIKNPFGEVVKIASPNGKKVLWERSFPGELPPANLLP